ncbi:MAG: cyclodeaminase/cyclohydrolase family protein [Lachnospiraceae bacterium]|nr:cyclodeaminase/cyclohydrolase family protein [Lachnospiraceae bacterium]
MTRDQIIEEFLLDLSSKSPVPGGGGASALAGAFGVSLGMMVASLTIGKKRYAAVEEEVIRLNQHLETLRDVFLRLADKDEEAFLPLSRGYAMPKETEEEKQIRSAYMENALYDAVLVPLSVMETALGAFESLLALARIGSKLAISDAGVAASFLQTAVTGAEMNVRINLRSMKEPERRTRLSERYEAYLQRADVLYRETMDVVKGRIG